MRWPILELSTSTLLLLSSAAGAPNKRGAAKPHAAPPSPKPAALRTQPSADDQEPLVPELKRLYAVLGGRYQVVGEVLSGEAGEKIGNYYGHSETLPALGGKYLRGTRVLTMPDEFTTHSETLTFYDAALGKYRQWTFTSRGHGAVESTGTLEEGAFVGKSADGTMTFTIKKRPDGKVEGASEMQYPDGRKLIQNYVATPKR